MFEIFFEKWKAGLYRGDEGVLNLFNFSRFNFYSGQSKEIFMKLKMPDIFKTIF